MIQKYLNVAEFGLIGRNLSHSFSAEFFNSKFEKERLAHRYSNFDLPNLNDVRAIFSKEQVTGMNVTIPYKTEIMSHLDRLDAAALAIGAVNTIKSTPNGLEGYNTDAFGFEKSLKKHLLPHHNRALVLGTGGASKAVCFVLKSMNIDHISVSRNPLRDQWSYAQLDAKTVSNHNLIVNCTPLGTFPKVKDFPNIPYEGIGPDHLLFDLVYNPAETEFLKRGKQHGAEAVNGLEMLIFQAEKAWEIWMD